MDQPQIVPLKSANLIFPSGGAKNGIGQIQIVGGANKHVFYIPAMRTIHVEAKHPVTGEVTVSFFPVASFLGVEMIPVPEPKPSVIENQEPIEEALAKIDQDVGC